MSDITDRAKIEVFFTNHSLRRSGISRLFQAGVDRKLVKESTGHSSDAVDKYQITSDKQLEDISSIISGENKAKVKVKEMVKNEESACDLEVSVMNKTAGNNQGCTCMKSNVKFIETEEVGKLLSDILHSKKAKRTNVKLQIEFDD